MTPNQKLAIALEYAGLVCQVVGWLLLVRIGCLVSRDCRRICRELKEEGDCIDPLKPLVARLDVLHTEFYGRDC